jgi:hypothetical protein
VAALDWISDAKPRLADVHDRKVLVARRSGFAGELLVQLIVGPPPSDFIKIGTSGPTEEEATTKCTRFYPWEALRRVLVLEDLWRRDREGYNALVSAAKAESEKALETLRTEGPADPSWAELETGAHFREWTCVPQRLVGASRRFIQAAARELHELGSGAPLEDRTDVLRRCVERFNELDRANGHFIESVEAEGIVNRLRQLAKLGGLGRDSDLADAWRHW